MRGLVDFVGTVDGSGLGVTFAAFLGEKDASTRGGKGGGGGGVGPVEGRGGGGLRLPLKDELV